jgi:metallo-beta-lactamase family protein
MKLAFYGAARTVTGTKHLLTLKNGISILLDCGLFQGMGAQTDDLNASFGFEPSQVSFLVLSHAHIDHSGLIPKLVKEGFSGTIYATAATMELAEILLYDSAEIQQLEAHRLNQRMSPGNGTPAEPLYGPGDVAEAMQLFKPIDYNTETEVGEGVHLLLTNSGHPIGCAAIHQRIQEDETEKRITFSGDVGRYRSLLLQPPAPFPQADYIILESTYGNTHHEIGFSTIKTINAWITKTCIEKGGKLIIPAFSVGRTQEVLYALNQLELEKRLPAVPYFVDSPLSLKATGVLKKHTELFNDRLQQVLEIDEDPFHFTGLRYVESAEDSRRLMEYSEPCVIISASGTGDAGRVRHHLHASLEDEKNGVLLVGYCGAQSTGGLLAAGAESVELFGDDCMVRAEVGQMSSMSAHGDADDLCQFLNCQDVDRVKCIFLVHGEYSVQQGFAARLERKGFTKVEVPSFMHEYELD